MTNQEWLAKQIGELTSEEVYDILYNIVINIGSRYNTSRGGVADWLIQDAKIDDDNQLPVNENRSLCKLRHKNGNCLCVGGFCTAVNDEICKSIRMSYEKGYVDGKMDEIKE